MKPFHARNLQIVFALAARFVLVTPSKSLHALPPPIAFVTTVQSVLLGSNMKHRLVATIRTASAQIVPSVKMDSLKSHLALQLLIVFVNAAVIAQRMSKFSFHAMLRTTLSVFLVLNVLIALPFQIPIWQGMVSSALAMKDIQK
jgi:hypothetical protein